ncbi:MAG: ankyrin repeat domain-containing protein [Motiliproteus sp.]
MNKYNQIIEDQSDIRELVVASAVAPMADIDPSINDLFGPPPYAMRFDGFDYAIVDGDGSVSPLPLFTQLDEDDRVDGLGVRVTMASITSFFDAIQNYSVLPDLEVLEHPVEKVFFSRNELSQCDLVNDALFEEELVTVIFKEKLEEMQDDYTMDQLSEIMAVIEPQLDDIVSKGIVAALYAFGSVEEIFDNFELIQSLSYLNIMNTIPAFLDSVADDLFGEDDEDENEDDEDTSANIFSMSGGEPEHGQVDLNDILALDLEERLDKYPLWAAIFHDDNEEGYKIAVDTVDRWKEDVNTRICAGETYDIPPIAIAAQFGSDYLKLLVENGADVNATNSDGMSAITFAAQVNSPEACKYLVSQGAKLNTVPSGEGGSSPLMQALENESEELLELFIDAGADIDWQNNLGWTVLKSAVKRGNQIFLDRLLAAGAKTDIYDYEGYVALHNASIDANMGILKSLISAGADVNLPIEGGEENDDNGRTALHEACINGNIAVIECLLNSGAKVRRGGQGIEIDPVLLAIGSTTDLEAIEIFDLFVKHGWRPNIVSLYWLANQAVETIKTFLPKMAAELKEDYPKEFFKVVLSALASEDEDGGNEKRILLKDSGFEFSDEEIAATDSKDLFGLYEPDFWPLLELSICGVWEGSPLAWKHEIPGWSVSEGLNVNDPVMSSVLAGLNCNQKLAVYIALDGGSKLIREHLASDTEIDPNFVIGEGDYDLLMIAAANSRADIVDDLITMGANPAYCRGDGGTALMDAAWKNDIDLAKKLLNAGANINAAGNNNRTAVLVAVPHDDFEMLRFLVSRGADLSIVLDNGQGTVSMALDANDPLEVAKELISLGADPLALNSEGYSSLAELAAEHGSSGFISLMSELGVFTQAVSIGSLESLSWMDDMDLFPKLDTDLLEDLLKIADKREDIDDDDKEEIVALLEVALKERKKAQKKTAKKASKKSSEKSKKKTGVKPRESS